MTSNPRFLTQNLKVAEYLSTTGLPLRTFTIRLLSWWCYHFLKTFRGNTPRSAHGACRHWHPSLTWRIFFPNYVLVGVKVWLLLAYLAWKPPLLNCTVVSLHDFEIAYVISKLVHSLAIDRMCNAISKKYIFMFRAFWRFAQFRYIYIYIYIYP